MATVLDEKEAHRIALVKRATQIEAVREKLKGAKADFAARQRAEEDRRKQFDNETKVINLKLDDLRFQLGGCGSALDELRRTYVSVQIRQAVSAAEREHRAALLLVQDAERETKAERFSIDALKARVASVPSAAAPGDIAAEIKRLEASHDQTQARLAKLRDLLATAEAALAKAKGEHDAAMAAALRI